jgi:hypothetical protein
MMSVPSAAEEAIFGPVPADAHVPDDIPDPAVPPGTIDDTPAPALPPTVPALPDALLPLAHGFCQYLQGQARMHGWLMDEHRHLMTTLDASLVSIRDWAREVFQSNEHSQYQMANALEKGLLLHQSHTKAQPYTAVIDARTPHGFPLRLTIEKATSGELIEELGRLEGWLQANGYHVSEGARFE